MTPEDIYYVIASIFLVVMLIITGIISIVFYNLIIKLDGLITSFQKTVDEVQIGVLKSKVNFFSGVIKFIRTIKGRG